MFHKEFFLWGYQIRAIIHVFDQQKINWIRLTHDTLSKDDKR